MELHLMQQFWLVPLYSHPEASIVVAVIFLLLLNSVEEFVGMVIYAEQSSVVNFLQNSPPWLTFLIHSVV